MRRFLTWLIVIFSSFSHAYAADYHYDRYPFTSAADASRFQDLIKEIRCVVCQNQSIADSNAPLAQDLRTKIYRLIKKHQSNQQVKDYLVKRYGDFILLQPRFDAKSALLWLFPILGCLTAGGLLFRLLTRERGGL